jgi:hypothetical protein
MTNYPQINIISKVYNGLFLSKLTNLLRLDTYDAIEIKEIFEDANDIAEKYIQKDIAYTLREYVFKNFSGTELLVDEGNYGSISAITSTDASGNITIITGYSVWHDSNNFTIIFASAINNCEIKVRFYSGFINDTIPKSIRRAIYIIINDLYDWERASYSVQQSKKSDVIERLLNPYKKIFFKNYPEYRYENYFINIFH